MTLSLYGRGGGWFTYMPPPPTSISGYILDGNGKIANHFLQCTSWKGDFPLDLILFIYELSVLLPTHSCLFKHQLKTSYSYRGPSIWLPYTYRPTFITSKHLCTSGRKSQTMVLTFTEDINLDWYFCPPNKTSCVPRIRIRMDPHCLCFPGSGSRSTGIL